MSEAELQAEAKVHGKLAKFSSTSTALTVDLGSKKSQIVPLRQVLSAIYDAKSLTLRVSYLTRKKKRGPMSLVHLHGQVEETKSELTKQFAETTLERAYDGIKRYRRLKILVNPHGGVGKGVALFNKLVEPVLRAAACTIDVVHTKKHGDAYDIAKSLPLDEFDALLTVSGDGLVHEVLNGFAHHAHPRKALRMPVAPIPTGSGNGLSLNILGLEEGFDVVAASLNAIKGSPMNVDVFSLTQNGKRTISFMSQALGLMADLDLGTEDLRWMGDSRFVYGVLRGLIKFKPCEVQLSYKPVEQDKHKMVETLRSRHIQDRSGLHSYPEPDDNDTLPEPQFALESTEGWTTFDEPLLYVYAGKGPYVGRDMMAFPVSLPDDGLIDVVAQSLVNSSRSDVLASLSGATKGEQYWSKSLHYIKAQAYRIKPLSDKGYLSIDGEAFPFSEFQVEVLPGLATLLSPHGFYNAPFGDTEHIKR